MNTMIIESLNIGLPRTEVFRGKEILTGMCKGPVSKPLPLGKLGFEGDGVGDLRHHGGPNKAVCVYGLNRYHHWERVLRAPLPPAAFGENLTVSDLHEDGVCIGDLFQIGTALLQISQPRQPCRTLAARYGRDDIIKLVIDSGFTGFYFRVLEEGVVEKGDPLILKERDPRGITVAFANHTYHRDNKNEAAIRKVLAVQALSESWQQTLNECLKRC